MSYCKKVDDGRDTGLRAWLDDAELADANRGLCRSSARWLPCPVEGPEVGNPARRAA